jgi:hypothetical protein
MLAIEQCVNIECCVLPYKSPSEALGLLGEAYKKAAMKKTLVYSGKNTFVVAERVSMKIHAAGDFLQQTTETSRVCVLCQVTNERVFRRLQQKQEYQMEAL